LQGEKIWKKAFFMANKGIAFTVNVSPEALFLFSVLMTKDLLTGQHFPILFTQWSLFSDSKI